MLEWISQFETIGREIEKYGGGGQRGEDYCQKASEAPPESQKFKSFRGEQASRPHS